MIHVVPCFINDSKQVYIPEGNRKIVMVGMSGTISISNLRGKYDLKPASF